MGQKRGLKGGKLRGVPGSPRSLSNAQDCGEFNQPAGAAVDAGADTRLKIWLSLAATLGKIATATMAIRPAIKAYSMRSWPRASFQILSEPANLRFRLIASVVGGINMSFIR